MLRSLVLVPLLFAGPASAAPQLQPQPPVPETAPAPAPAPPPAAVPAPAPSTDSVRRIPVAELQQAMKSGKVVIVDVRAESDYRATHIPGALHIPFTEIEQRAKELPRESFIVTYCT